MCVILLCLWVLCLVCSFIWNGAVLLLELSYLVCLFVFVWFMDLFCVLIICISNIVSTLFLGWFLLTIKLGLQFELLLGLCWLTGWIYLMWYFVYRFLCGFEFCVLLSVDVYLVVVYCLSVLFRVVFYLLVIWIVIYCWFTLEGLLWLVFAFACI